MEKIVLSIDARMAAVTKWADRLDQESTTTQGTQAAQQRAIDQLAARVARIERELHPDERP